MYLIQTKNFINGYWRGRMNNKQAKRIKKEVYGDYSPRSRKYYRDKETLQIFADGMRRKYQKAKKEYKNA